MQALKQSKNIEMKELMDGFLTEIREENNRLKRGLYEQKQSENQQPSMNDTLVKTEAPKQHVELPVEEKKDEFSPSIQGQVYQLYDQGVPIEEIAKRLDRGKTEIQLMVKFKKGNSS